MKSILITWKIFLLMSIIAIATPPSNDNFADAIVLTGLTPASSVNNTEANRENGEPANTGYRTVWYTYRPPATGRLTLTSSNTNNFVIAATVYLGENFSTLRVVAGSSEYISSTTRTFTFPVAANTDYRICIGSYSNQPQFSGLIQLGLSLDNLADVSYLNVPYAATMANDTFDQRSVLSGNIVGNSVSSIGYNISATNEVAASEPTVAGSRTVWWTYRPSETGRLTISTVGSDGFSSNIIVYLGDNLATLRNIAGLTGTGPTTFTIPVTANTDYHISVGGGNALTNSGSIVLSCLLDNQADVAYLSIPKQATWNDQFATRVVLPGGTVSAIGYNMSAAREPLEPAGTGERTIWWDWIAPATGTTIIDLTGSDAISKKVSVWRGPSISSLTQVAASTQSSTPTLTLTATAGETYHIAVANNSSSSSGGSVVLTIDGPPVPPDTAPEITVQQPVGTKLTDGKSSKAFGSVKVGVTSTAKIFTINNTGTAKLSGLAITKNGANASEFKVSGLAATSLAPGKKTTFKVTFKPKKKGTRKAAIHIKSNDKDEKPFDIKLAGEGVSK